MKGVQLSFELVRDLPPFDLEVERIQGATSSRSLVHSYGMVIAPCGRWIVAALGHIQPKHFALAGEVRS